MGDEDYFANNYKGTFFVIIQFHWTVKTAFIVQSLSESGGSYRNNLSLTFKVLGQHSEQELLKTQALAGICLSCMTV